MRLCKKCNEARSEDAFYRHSDGRLRATCRACMATRFSSYYAANKRAVLSRMIRNAYGITYEEYRLLLEAAGFRCESCGEQVLESGTGPREQVANVDHCHVTGNVHGVLCMRCNRTLGLLGESPELIRKPLAYASKRKAQLKIPRAH